MPEPDLNFIFGGPPLFLLNWVAVVIGYIWLTALVVGGTMILVSVLSQKWIDRRITRELRQMGTPEKDQPDWFKDASTERIRQGYEDIR